VAAVTAGDAVIDPVPLAIGVLMHRHSLLRGAAQQRLQRLAAEQDLSLPAQAERLLGAVEELARTGG
jgi:response regulator NasT